jgi:hypothetical protein
MKPAPLTPPDCDLRDFSWMPLDVLRLRDSDLTVLSSGDAFRAAVLLWCASWHQVPAASLPTDDRLLANLAGYGRDMAGWAEVRGDAIRGFVECSDGRLYHRVVAEKALEADEQRKAQKERTRKATDARRGGKRDGDRNDQKQPPPNRDDNRGDGRNEVQQTGPDQTRPEKTEPSPKFEKPVVVVVPSATTTTEAKNASQGKEKCGLDLLGRPLPVDWLPDEATTAKVIADFGMTETDIEAELLTFHAYNAERGTFSKNWSATWQMWCARWKERAAEKPKLPLPRVEVNHQPSAQDWDRACALWARGGSVWSFKSLGPDPQSQGCRCPTIFLTKHGIDPATGQWPSKTKEPVLVTLTEGLARGENGAKMALAAVESRLKDALAVAGTAPETR